mgnify:CR=1 FL=1
MPSSNMMNKDFKIGQLVYIPSRVDLLNYGKRRKPELNVPQKHYVVEEPISLLVTEIINDIVGVHYRGETWYVNQKDIYSD